MKVIIMRGVPGTGKSTYIKNNFPGAFVCSADKFFVTGNDEYVFNAAQLGAAHKWCMRQFVDTIIKPYQEFKNLSNPEYVVVDNTNTTTLEWFPYFRVAEAFGAEVSIVELHPKDIEICRRNVHNVPFETIKKMAARFEGAIPNRFGIKVERIEV